MRRLGTIKASWTSLLAPHVALGVRTYPSRAVPPYKKMGQRTCPYPISTDQLVGLNAQAHVQHGVIFRNGKLDVAALAFHNEHLAAQSFDERRVIGAHEAL